MGGVFYRYDVTPGLADAGHAREPDDSFGFSEPANATVVGAAAVAGEPPKLKERWMQRVVGGGGGGGGGLSNHPAIASPLGPYSTASDTSADDMAAGGTLSHTLSHAPTFGINFDPFVTPC